MQEKSSRRNVGKIIIVLLLLILLAVGILLLVQFKAAEKPSPDWFDPTATTGSLEGKTPEEIQAELDRVVEEGMFNIAIASAIVFEPGSKQGEARIENIAANHYHMSVVITLDDTDEVVYESKGIKPGQFVEYIELTKELPPGMYNATALFTAHHQEDYSTIGQAAAKVVLIIQE